MSMDSMRTENIHSFLRIRPLSDEEIKKKEKDVLNYCLESNRCFIDSTSKTYEFEKVLAPSITQEEVYDIVVKPTISDVLNGYNCSILTYGQSGSGKTYTMVGEKPFSSMNNRCGILPRVIENLFTVLNEKQQQFQVIASYIEIYNEVIYDLLGSNTENTLIKLYDDPNNKKNVIIRGAAEILVNTVEEAMTLLEKGTLQKHLATTYFNIESSRSHTIFILSVMTYTTVMGEIVVNNGKYYLVDLAGSEKYNKMSNSHLPTEKQLMETKNINISLLSLKRCIQALVNKDQHIPYRESNLTRILQAALGGNCKTRIIATVSPIKSTKEESFNTLIYATMAMGVCNTPIFHHNLLSDTNFIKKNHKLVDELVDKFHQMCIYYKNGAISLDNIALEISIIKNSLQKIKNKSETILSQLQIKQVSPFEKADDTGFLLQILSQKIDEKLNLVDETFQSLNTMSPTQSNSYDVRKEEKYRSKKNILEKYKMMESNLIKMPEELIKLKKYMYIKSDKNELVLETFDDHEEIGDKIQEFKKKSSRVSTSSQADIEVMRPVHESLDVIKTHRESIINKWKDLSTNDTEKSNNLLEQIEISTKQRQIEELQDCTRWDQLKNKSSSSAGLTDVISSLENELQLYKESKIKFAATYPSIKPPYRICAENTQIESDNIASKGENLLIKINRLKVQIDTVNQLADEHVERNKLQQSVLKLQNIVKLGEDLEDALSEITSPISKDSPSKVKSNIIECLHLISECNLNIKIEEDNK